MKISELVSKLEAIKATHGDVEVRFDDVSDYGTCPVEHVSPPGETNYVAQELKNAVLLK